MKRVFVSGIVLAASAALGVSAVAWADNPLGAYVGAGVGTSNVGRNDDYDYGYYGGYHDNDVAWKAIVGVRPIPFAGAEAEWLDFGSGNGHDGYYGNNYFYSNASSHPKAALLYGVGYLPLPLPFLDVYGKAGVARLQTDITTYAYSSGYCPPPYSACSSPIAYRTDQWDWKFAWGAGVQFKWQDLAFRAEYERIDSQFGDPAAATVSATWTF
jgi:outer membrane protein with beta-barrel domain